jgi:hypothetical protein
VDFGPSTALTRTTSWIGAPGLLGVNPLEMGASRLFFQDGAIVELASPDAPPVVHPGPGAPWRELQATDHAAWITTLDASDEPTGLIRWTAAGATALLPADTWTNLRVVPVDDDSALVSARRQADSAPTVFRVDAGGTITPVDLGPRPALLGHARLR